MDPRRPSITDFLTDGSLAALCQVLGDMTRSRVSLHDERGRRIIHTDGDPPWHVGREGEPARRIARALEATGTMASVIPDDGRVIEPLVVGGGRVVGAILITADPDEIGPEMFAHLRGAVRRVVQTVDELFDQEVMLAQRSSELSILFRLSSLLVAAHDIEEIFRVALRSAVDILGVDGAMVHLREGDTREHVLRASVEIPEASLAELRRTGDPGPALDVPAEAIARAARAGGFDGVVSSSLEFRGRRLGVIHFFSRDELLLVPSEQALLQTINEQISAAVASAKLIDAERRSEAVQRQLTLARDVQHRMLPREIPEAPGLEVAARYFPSFDIGGDFYDFIELGQNLGILVGDVAGKGVPAALLMSSVRATIRALATDVYHLDDLMAQANGAMVRDTLPNEFATVFYGVIDGERKRLTYCSAGHDPTYLLRAGGDGTIAIRELSEGGTVVGVDADATYDRGTVDLRDGDVIVAYTDGVIDARAFDGTRFGRERFKERLTTFLRDTPDATPDQILDHVVWEVRRFVGVNPAADDLTIVAVRVRAG